MQAGVVALLLLIAILVTLARGGRMAFAWVYFPSLLLVPYRIVWALPGVPDLTPPRAIALGIVLALFLSGKASSLAFRWKIVDFAVFLLPVSFAISYATFTDAMGFVHQLPMLMFDWFAPYLFARCFMGSRAELRQVFTPMVLSMSLAAFFALYEARMAVRILIDLWNLLGLDLAIPRYLAGWRWGFLRALGVLTHPIILGAVFATMAPLALAWGVVEPRRKYWAWLVAGACCVACLCGMSRGPILILVVMGALTLMLAYRARVMLGAIVIVMALVSPIVIDQLMEAVAYTQNQIDTTGNLANESGYYRLALLLVYLEQIGDAGFWGDRLIAGSEFGEMWSMDNGYLYLFFQGGWIGGGLFVAVVLALLYRGVRSVFLARGSRERQLRAMLVGSFLIAASCTANVWFATDWGRVFWISAGLAMNASLLRWPRRPKQVGTDPPEPAVARAEPGVGSVDDGPLPSASLGAQLRRG